MRIILAIVLAGLVAPVTSAQQAGSSSAVAGEATVISVLDDAVDGDNVIQPVAFVQSGSSTRGAVAPAVAPPAAGSASRVIVEPNLGGSSTRSGIVTEPSSVVSGEVVSGEVVYGEPVPYTEGTVVQESSGCGCGGSAPVVTYSPAPAIVESAPAAAPCCPPKRRGFFRSLFGN